MLDVVGRIDPPNKFELFAQVLQHPNPVLRMEVLQTIGRNPSKECFAYLKKTIEQSEEAPLRQVAIRALPDYERALSLPVVLSLISDNKALMKREPGEQKAIFSTAGQMKNKETDAILEGYLSAKKGLLLQKNKEALKAMVIEAYEQTASVSGLKLMAEVAKDKKKHSDEIRAKANTAALKIKAKLLGK